MASSARYKVPQRYAESEEQKAFFRRLTLHKYRGESLRRFCFSIPNGGTAGTRQAMLAAVRRKAEGLTAGVSDIECMIAVPPHTGLFIEMKRTDGTPSDVSEAQRDFMDLAASCGRKCVVAFGAEQAWQYLMEYLSPTSRTLPAPAGST